MSKKAIIFIRKGTGRPFSGDQYSTVQLREEILPGFFPDTFGWCGAGISLQVPASDSSNEAICVQPEQAKELTLFSATAGPDAQGRPSFLTVEEYDGSGYWALPIEKATYAAERDIKRMDLAQSERYLDDYATERYVAQWSLVNYPVRRRFHRSTPALYACSAKWDLSTYRSLGQMHLCLGELQTVSA
jgi:hypothetical protein